MALLWAGPSPFSSVLQSRKHTAIAIPFTSRTQIPATLTLNKFSASVSASPSNCYPSIQSTCSVSSAESESSAPTGVFIKGLPKSTTEGQLKKAFSQYGEVVKVKIVVEKMSKQSLGSAFVWFTSKESAKLAVEEMNGKFFNGRFVLVKIAEPGVSKHRGWRTRH
ncbi:RNA binding protein [Melia azedarach]|uniref:RNA binding protein n=1 Tax=Melia azedarach TaxID=155640 RepID=A0ACC1YEZ3_MELAZ|nr:RNA binding protein [Melia azedarach]